MRLFVPVLGLDLPQVELQLLALQHVAVGPAALAGPGGDGGQDTAGHELVGEALLNLGVLLSLGVLLGGLLGPLLVEVGLLGVGQLGALLTTKGQGKVRLVPLPEGSGVNYHDGVLDKSLGSDPLVVSGVVHHVDDPGLAGDALGAPGEVTLVQTQGAVLLVAATDAEGVDPLRRELGHGRGPRQLELPLLPDGDTPSSCGSALMPVIS